MNKLSELFKKYNMECRVVMENHDAFDFTVDEFYEILGNEYRPQNIINHNSKSLIFIDACHFKIGVHYMPGDKDRPDTFYPKTEKLESILGDVKGDAFALCIRTLIQKFERITDFQTTHK